MAVCSPVSNKSQDVVDTLVNTIKQNKVDIKEETIVNEINVEDNGTFEVTTDKGIFQVKVSLLQLVELVCLKQVQRVTAISLLKIRHSITELFPTEVPITSQSTLLNPKNLKV